jgi:multiple sugar transport system ATP-binding protein
MRGVPRRERSARVDEAAATLGIERLLERLPGELSGGERQRVAMGRAIVRKPRVFLFDEPLSNLDAALRAELRVEIAALVRRLGVTSLYVTHDQTEAMTMADRIVVMNKGRLQQIGPPRTIYEDPANAFVAGFLGSPPINWIELTPRNGMLHGAGAEWPIPHGIPIGAGVRAAVRPEHVRMAGEGVVVEGVVAVTEPLGAETHVLLDASGTFLRARAPGFDAPLRGERVRFVVSPRDVLWFDPDGGDRLRARA